MTGSYTGLFEANIVVKYEPWLGTTGLNDAHGNPTGDDSWGAAVDRSVYSVQPLHKIPHRDPVGPEYEARIMIDFIMEVPDASLYHKNDRVTWNNTAFLVQGFPFNYGDANPFGMDKTMFGGSVHIARVT